MTATFTTLPSSQYARARAAADYFRISESTLWHWAATRPGFPQGRRIGPRTTLFDLRAIEVFLMGGSAA